MSGSVAMSCFAALIDRSPRLDQFKERFSFAQETWYVSIFEAKGLGTNNRAPAVCGFMPRPIAT